MAFKTESAMRDVAKQALATEFGDSNTEALDEFEYGSGRADIVLTKLSDSYLEHRLNALSITDYIQDDSHLRTFLQLHSRGTVSKSHFYEVGAQSKSEKRAALNWLIDNGFVEEVKEEYIKTAPQLRRHVTTAYSIELKLNKWKEALRQAFRGKGFSNYQYVVLDEEYANRALDNIEMFRDHGIGLMSISPDGDYEIHHRPDRDTPYSLINKWRLNEQTLCYSLEVTSQYAGPAGD